MRTKLLLLHQLHTAKNVMLERLSSDWCITGEAASNKGMEQGYSEELRMPRSLFNTCSVVLMKGLRQDEELDQKKKGNEGMYVLVRRTQGTLLWVWTKWHKWSNNLKKNKIANILKMEEVEILKCKGAIGHGYRQYACAGYIVGNALLIPAIATPTGTNLKDPLALGRHALLEGGLGCLETWVVEWWGEQSETSKRKILRPWDEESQKEIEVLHDDEKIVLMKEMPDIPSLIWMSVLSEKARAHSCSQ